LLNYYCWRYITLSRIYTGWHIPCISVYFFFSIDIRLKTFFFQLISAYVHPVMNPFYFEVSDSIQRVVLPSFCWLRDKSGHTYIFLKSIMSFNIFALSITLRRLRIFSQFPSLTSISQNFPPVFQSVTNTCTRIETHLLTTKLCPNN